MKSNVRPEQLAAIIQQVGGISETAPAPRHEPVDPWRGRVVVTDFDVPFAQMVWLLIKLAVAAIPAGLILGLVGMLLSGVFVGSCGALLGRR